jgi:tetratricopeptide (TPR) repeat protein
MYKRLPIRFLFVACFLFCCNHQIIAQQQERIRKRMDSLINVLPKQKEDSLKALNILNIATIKQDLAQHTGNWNDPIEWTHKALNLSKKINYKWGIGRCYWLLGVTWMKAGNYPEAIKYFSEGLKAAFKNGNQNLAIACNSFICDCYMNLGDYSQVIKVSLSAIETSRQKDLQNWSDNNGVEEGFSMKIGKAYAKLLNYPEALNWFEKVLKKHRVVAKEQILLAMASVQLEMKNYDEALKNYLTVLPILTSDKKLNEKPVTEYNGLLGGLYMQIGEVYYRIGLIQRDTSSISSYNKAINYLNKSLPLLKEGAGGNETLMNVYALLKQACEAINDYQNALRYTNLYTVIKDSIYSKANYLQIASLQVKYATEKAAAELKIEQEKEKVRNTTILAEQKMEQEKILTDERITNEKTIAEQKLAQEKAISIAGEKANFEKSIAVEKIRNEEQQANNLLLMGLILVVVTSFFLILYFRQRHEKKRAVEKVETIHQMAELEMQSLRSQLNPHFMFNSLNSIQTLILKEDTDKSHSYLSRFARLLRMLLENADKPFIPLRMEIDFLQLYLGLESLRVPDMQYAISTDPALNTEQTLIPNMFLQPYVENAIWHGLSHKETDKKLQIRISWENGIVNYEIEDNGVGRKKSEELKSLFRKQHQSKGMELLNKRINLLNTEYGSTIQTEISDVIRNNEVAGTLVTIKIPVKLSEPLLN